jgi:hypothetical protein
MEILYALIASLAIFAPLVLCGILVSAPDPAHPLSVEGAMNASRSMHLGKAHLT